MKQVSLEKAKTFYEEATRTYDRLNSYFERKEAQNELDAIMGCFNKLGDLWWGLLQADENGLTIGDDWWQDGDLLISEALGTTIRYWNTDIPEQLTLCDDLVGLLGYPELTEQ